MSGKVKYYQLSSKEKKEYLDMFYDMVESLKTREEVKNFFKDLLTLSEMVMIARRLKIASLLLDGSTYEEIRKKLKVGLTTISNVERWLRSGFGGYEKALKGYKKEKQTRRKDFPVTAFDQIRKKYPLHFFLCNALLKIKNKE